MKSVCFSNIVLISILLTGCAINTDLTHSSSPVDTDPNLQDYQKTCQSMTYVPNGYSVEEDTYIYSTRHEFRPMEQSILKYSYIRHNNKILILATPKDLEQIRKIYPIIPDIMVQTQSRAELCHYIAVDTMYKTHPIVSFANKMNALYQSCPANQCADNLAQVFKGTPETLTSGSETSILKTHPDTCYLAFMNHNSGMQPIQLFPEATVRFQRFRFQYPDIKIPVEGICASDSFDIHISQSQTPLVISFARNAFPAGMAGYVDAIVTSDENTAPCPVIDRDDEYTFHSTLKNNTFIPTLKMTKPHPEPSSNTLAAIDCSHPYQWYDYFVHPIPGTLYYYKNTPVIITKHHKQNTSIHLTVISLSGEQFDVSTDELKALPDGTPKIPQMTAGQCQCPAADEIPNEVKKCGTDSKFFDCCEQIIRQNSHDKFKDEMSFNAYVYHVCHMDQIKAYEIQTNLWTGHDASYPLRSYFNTQNTSRNESPVKDLSKDARILTHTEPVPVEDLMAGKSLSNE